MNELFEIIGAVAEIAEAINAEAKKGKKSDQAFDEKIRQLHQYKSEEASIQSQMPNDSSAKHNVEALKQHSDVRKKKQYRSANQRKELQLRADRIEEERTREVKRKQKASRAKVRQMILHQEIMNKPMSLRDEGGL